MGRDGPPASSSTSSQPGHSAPAETSTSAPHRPPAHPPPLNSRRRRPRPPRPPPRPGRPAAESSTPPVVVAPPPVIAPVQSAVTGSRRPRRPSAAAPVQPRPRPSRPAWAQRARCSRWSTPSGGPPAAARWSRTPGLASVARAHSADMRDRDFFSHVNPDGLDAFDRAKAGRARRPGGEHRARSGGRRRRHGCVDVQQRPPPPTSSTSTPPGSASAWSRVTTAPGGPSSSPDLAPRPLTHLCPMLRADPPAPSAPQGRAGRPPSRREPSSPQSESRLSRRRSLPN